MALLLRTDNSPYDAAWPRDERSRPNKIKPSVGVGQIPVAALDAPIMFHLKRPLQRDLRTVVAPIADPVCLEPASPGTGGCAFKVCDGLMRWLPSPF